MSETYDIDTKSTIGVKQSYIFQWRSGNYRLIGPFSDKNTASILGNRIDRIFPDPRWATIDLKTTDGAYKPALRDPNGLFVDAYSKDLRGAAYFIMRWYETFFEFWGPFQTADDARTVGFNTQANFGDDPRWELMILDVSLPQEPVTPIILDNTITDRIMKEVRFPT